MGQSFSDLFRFGGTPQKSRDEDPYGQRSANPNSPLYEKPEVIIAKPPSSLYHPQRAQYSTSPPSTPVDDDSLINHKFYRDILKGSLVNDKSKCRPISGVFHRSVGVPQFSEIVREQSKKKDEETGKNEKLNKQVLVYKELWIEHYCNRHNILFVGEGDFSFSACLAQAFGSATSMIATSLDSFDFLRSNYSKAVDNIQLLEHLGCIVFHGVDATKMSCITLFKRKKFDRIIFNFPHAGFTNRDKSEEFQIREHQKLVRGFLSNAMQLLGPRGEIHISHKTAGFHGRWNIEILASNLGLRLVQKVRFELTDYPGYNTKYGFGGDKNFDCYPSQTYKFAI